ncbi:MAG: DUF3267 domain-containing protein [Armatimonadetes bacterium]|nr:DUF3267 domain-containing protein [Armatimonadota bacterium]
MDEWPLRGRVPDWAVLAGAVLFLSGWLFAGLGALYHGDPALRLAPPLPLRGVPGAVQVIAVIAAAVILHEGLHALVALIVGRGAAFHRGWAPGTFPFHAVARGPVSRDRFVIFLLVPPALLFVAGLLLLGGPPALRTVAFIGLLVNAVLATGDAWLTAEVSTHPPESLVVYAPPDVEPGRYELYAPAIHRKGKKKDPFEGWWDYARLLMLALIGAAAVLTIAEVIGRRFSRWYELPAQVRGMIAGVMVEQIPGDWDAALRVSLWPPLILGGAVGWAWIALRDRRRTKRHERQHAAEGARGRGRRS